MGPKKGSTKKQAIEVPDSDHIVFGDDKKKKKSKGPSEEPPGPSKPTARQIVGGASWTGKLPVNLLSEFCQRQKWNKPDYSMRQMPARDGDEKLYRSDVKLSKTDPKTRETTTIPSMRLPASHAHLGDQSSALEARHFAATYALFRIQSMKNIHMTLPPQFRDLWKGEFSQLKKEDVEAGQAWKYQEDPFEAEAKRQEIHRAMEKLQDEEKKRQEAQASRGREGFEGGGAIVLPVREKHTSKAWERAPRAAMGQQIRMDIEELIRKRVVWNQYNFSIDKREKDHIVANVTKLGFRRSHVEEALEHCKDYEEVLEWLLVHVPEDDLPSWTFPPNYNAGVTLASGDLEKEGKLKRLAVAGYPAGLCAEVLRARRGDEAMAAFDLQQTLVPAAETASDEDIESASSWKEETETLEAIFGGNFAVTGPSQCAVSMSTTNGKAFKAYFRCPGTGYPHKVVPGLSIEMKGVPAYIRLSATRRAVLYAQSQLVGEVMIYSICQWLETELQNAIENPGRLSELRINSPSRSDNEMVVRNEKGKTSLKPNGKPAAGRNRRTRVRPDAEMLEQWTARQTTPDQLKMNGVRRRLPAWTKQEQIIQCISKYQVTIISGETGSGKSTQTIQFVFDHAVQNSQGSKTSIVCTQPRRVAALSLADRVSSERCSKIGGEVGYIIRGESKVSDQTTMTFMTTGVLLRRLQSSPSIKEALTDISHVFVDEVHERSLDTDFLLALLKECATEQPKLKIVLMSATIDADIFSNYFGGAANVGLVNIEGRTHPVQDLYLEDALGLTYPNLTDFEITKTIQTSGSGIKYDMIRDLVFKIDEDLGEQSGSILIFLPGTLEIDQCIRAVTSNPRIFALPLHASLLPADQRKVFLPAPPGRRKVVAATNVAETSITIEDVVVVIDTGRVKETNYDTENNIVRLDEVWASQAACKQRRGRAGRVRAGVCYKLFTKNLEAKMPPKNLPEIQRVPLEQLCLSVKATRADCDVAEFLSQTLTPPNSGAVANAVKTLHTMNALENGRLTALGTCLAMVPADLRCAKLLIYGALFDCLEPCLTISAILAVKSPFVNPRDRREEANEARMSFPHSNGDLLLDMRAYDEWYNLSNTLRHGALHEWCSSHFVSQQTMRDIASTRRQLLDSLKDAGLVPVDYRSTAQSETMSDNSDTSILLTALIAASLQPQLALIAFPSKKYIASMSGAKELDPEAKTIKFFIPDESTGTGSKEATPVSTRPSTPKPGVVGSVTRSNVGSQSDMPSLTRVFVHPSSCLFSAQTFPRHSTHVSYFTKIITSKPFVRNLSPLNIYSLLLFGGKVELDTSGHGLIVGGTWKVQGWARIGVLISRLRVLLDEELKRTVEEGGVLLGRMSEGEVIHVVRRLLVLNGQDQ